MSMLQQKRQSIRQKIKYQHRMAYFASRREERLKELVHSQELELMSEQVFLMEVYQSSGGVDFDRIYQYTRIHAPTSNTFVFQIAELILTHCRTNQGALSVLCLLLQTSQDLQKLLEERSYLLKQLLDDNLESMDNLYPTIIILYKVLSQADRKESFAWLPPYYSVIVNRMEGVNLVLLLIAEASKCFGLLPAFEVVRVISDVKTEEVGEEVVRVACEMLMRCFHFCPTLEYFALVVVWVTARLKEQALTPSLSAGLLQALASLFRLEEAKQFIPQIVRHDHEIIRLLLYSSLTESGRIRASVVGCLCKIIISISPEEAIKLVERHPVGEPLARAFELDLDSRTKFDLLCSIVVFFEVWPESVREFEAWGAMRSIWQCESSEVQLLREMGSFIIDRFQLAE